MSMKFCVGHPLALAPRAAGRSLSLFLLAVGLSLPVFLFGAQASASVPVEAVSEKKKKVVKKQLKRKKVRTRTRTRTRQRTTRRTYTHRRHRHKRSRVVYAHRSPRRTRVVSDHHHHKDDRRVVTKPARRDGPFLGLGLGFVGIDNELGVNGGGTGVNFGLGVRDGNMALEVGLLAAAQPIDDEGEQVQDLNLSGLTVDAKLYLPLGRSMEPYALAGLGFMSVGTDADDANGFNTSLNLGGGVDLRLTRSLAIGGRYTMHGFFFDEAPESSAGVTDQTWSAMGTLTAYF
jgi:opacity protein-like surface antigen